MCSPSATSAIEPQQQATDDFGDHHKAAQRYHHPCTALVLFMAFAKKYVIMAC
jgi:hypothetical protein